MRQLISKILLFALILAIPARAQEPVDQAVIARIKTEGFQHSQVMETIFYLTDVHGRDCVAHRITRPRRSGP
jgi:hypothetical protein